MRYTILKQGSGEPVKTGQQVAIYESMGYLNGQQLHAIEKPASPIRFTLGEGQVINGVDEGVRGMKVGEIRQLIVPPTLSQRSAYPDFLSKDSTLVYRIEVVEVVN